MFPDSKTRRHKRLPQTTGQEVKPLDVNPGHWKKSLPEHSEAWVSRGALLLRVSRAGHSAPKEQGQRLCTSRAHVLQGTEPWGPRGRLTL